METSVSVIVNPFTTSVKKQLSKKPSITNWKICWNKETSKIRVEWWEGGHGTSIGHGYRSGAFVTVKTNHEKITFIPTDIMFDPTCDSWFFKDTDNKFHRASWPDCFRNPRYPHHKTRDEVTQMINKGVKIQVWN
jgi:hypothetical protein